MKRDKKTPPATPTAATPTGENTINELEESVGGTTTHQANNKGTKSKAADESYLDQVDHNLDKHQRLSLLPASDSSIDDLCGLEDTTTIVGTVTSNSISNRLAAFVPNIMVKQHQKNLNGTDVDNKTSAKMGKKMRQKNNNHQSGDDLEANDKTRAPTNFWHKSKWILLVLMSIALIFTALVFALYPTTLSDNEDQCYSNNAPFQQARYNLFATKTLYTSALYYLGKVPLVPTLTSSVTFNSFGHANPSSMNYDKSSINVPKIFSSQETLDLLNRRLIDPNFGCKPKQLYFIGRHAARLPSSDTLEQINKTIEAIKARIDLSRYQIASSTQEQTPSTSPPTIVNSIENKGNRSDVVCLDPIIQFKQWTGLANSDQGNLLITTGAQESVAIAQRFKKIYPEMFNGKLTNITFGTTREERTGQTAVTFMRQMDNLDLTNLGLDVCQPEISSVDDSSDRSHSIVEGNECYQRVTEKLSLEKLRFHHQCKSYNIRSTPITYGFNLRNSTRSKYIAESVSKNLKLTKEEDMLTIEETKTVYDVCRYESALTRTPSIWCSLFTENDLKFYEYLSDIDDFFNSAYGHQDQYRSACPVTLDILKEFNSESRKTNPEARFYFTHSDVIQKLIAASIDLSKDPEYDPDKILENLKNRSVPKNRQWQTSLFTPFSANLAFTLYECQSSPVKSENHFYKEFNVKGSNMFVVASLNEQPIILDGCQENICDMTELMLKSRIFSEKECNLEEICKKKFVVT